MARRLWHISDVHLSFDSDGQIKKPMEKRRWALKSWTYKGYLEKMQEFAFDCISEEDFVCITGDIVHDMKQPLVQYSLRWLRVNIPGTIVICRGNHDIYWNVNEMREIISDLNNFYILDENEILSIGPYTFGCFSNHKCKSNIGVGDGTDAEYLRVAANLARQAAHAKTTPVFLSHYPPSLQLAKLIGDMGIKAYLSGHIHCTSSDDDAVNGLSWYWYDQGAVHTDDKYINDCFFSTGTTDVLLAKHKQSFKEITCLQKSSINKKQLKKLQMNAASTFKVANKFATFFEKTDPFNPQNEVCGYICRKKGPMQGSLYITHIAGVEVEPQLIYGTPKLQYPYKDQRDSTEYKQWPEATSYVISEKWNGMNVMFYKYKGLDGHTYLTAKSKGTPFINDSEVGLFLSLTKKALGGKTPAEFASYLMENDKYQSESYELCGTEEPHLVKYDFPLKLKNLFLTEYSGKIKPVVAPWCRIEEFKDGDALTTVCMASQQQDLRTNAEFREERGLIVKYEYDHFATEGKVLYLLDKDGYLIDRIMYKIKPQDVESVHWASFDKDLRGKTLEAIKKIKSNEEELTEDNIRMELDMGPKEWSKFSKGVMRFVESGEDRDCRVVILCGLPGSGKSTIASIMEGHGYVRINQDTLGSRKACKTLMGSALANNKSVVIDRCNFNEEQRASWVDLAQKFGVSEVKCVWLDVSPDECMIRMLKRNDHPTIKTGEDAERALKMIQENWVEPTIDERFSEVVHINSPGAADAYANLIMERWGK